MIPHCITRDGGTIPQPGWVLAREIASAGPQPGFAKGHVLGAADLTRLVTLPWRELHVIEPEPGDIYETEAGARIAGAAAGPGVEVGSPGGGHWPLSAAHRGLLRVAVDALTRLNDVAGACVYTRFDGQVVDAGMAVGRAKVTPLILAADAVERAERIAREAGGLVRVAAFRRATIGVVVQETLDARAASRFTEALTDKISWFGSQLLTPIFVPSADAAIADGIAQVVQAGATIIFMAGTKSLDPLDPAFLALHRLGADLDRYGVPAHPGSLLWLGHWGDRPVLGLPTCGLFSQLTSFDLILPRLLAGEPVDAHALSTLGHGGLLSHEVSFFPPYARHPTASVEEAKSAK
jgi:hypothetical protein